MVKLLKELSSQDQSGTKETNKAFENLKFARGERLTAKEQRELYQQKVNQVFRK